MLPEELQSRVDKVWNDFWPGNSIKPLAVIDFFTCLFFIKQLDDVQILKEEEAVHSGQPIQKPVYTIEQQELRWSTFKNMDFDSMYQAFTKEGGVFDFVSTNGYKHSAFGLFMKEPVSIVPTRALLARSVNLISSLDRVGDNIRGDVFEYLLSKVAVSGEDGQFPTPRSVVRLMVEMMEPTPDDVIYDPAAGSGGFLVACAGYIKEKYPEAFLTINGNYRFSDEILVGTESDPVMARIGAMNMMLHGIKKPFLKETDALSKSNTSFTEQATLIITNPPFTASPDKALIDDDLLKAGNSTKADLYFLALILRGLKKGGRAAVVVPKTVLSEGNAAYKQIRRQLLEEHKLEAVVAMPGSVFKPYTEADMAMLIFTKSPAAVTDAVWFYDLQADEMSHNDTHKEAVTTAADGTRKPSGIYNKLPDVLTLWKNRRLETGDKREDKSFFVPVDELKSNGYDLNRNRYTKPIAEKKALEPAAPIAQKPSLVTDNSLYEELNTVKEKAAPSRQTVTAKKAVFSSFLLLALVISLGAFAAYFVFFKEKDRPKILADAKIVLPSDTIQDYTNNNLDEDNQLGQTTFAEEAKENKNNPIHLPSKKEINSGSSLSATTEPEVNTKRTTGASVAMEKRVTVPALNDISDNIVKTRYQVVSRAYFHDQPNDRTRRKAFINHWNNAYATINPLDEKNGFIYVAFTNHQGQTSRGWLRKKDLKPVQVELSIDDIK